MVLPLLECLNGRHVTNRLLWNGVIINADIVLDGVLEIET